MSLGTSNHLLFPVRGSNEALSVNVKCGHVGQAEMGLPGICFCLKVFIHVLNSLSIFKTWE